MCTANILHHFATRALVLKKTMRGEGEIEAGGVADSTYNHITLRFRALIEAYHDSVRVRGTERANTLALTSTKISSRLPEVATFEPSTVILAALRKRLYAFDEIRVMSIVPEGDAMAA